MRLLAIGLAAGFFSALLGVGGGIIVVPALLLLLHFELRPAAATSLAAIGITALVGTITYAVHGDVQADYGALLGVPAAIGAIGGASLQQRLHARTLSLLFAALLVGIAVKLLL